MTSTPPLRRVAVFNDTRTAGHYGCEIVMQQLVSGLRARRVEPVWFHPVRSDWRERPDAIPRKPEIDAIVVNGEGSIHHSATRPRAVYLSQLAAFAQDTLGVPAYLVNAGIDTGRPLTAQSDSFWWGGTDFATIEQPYGEVRKIVRGFDRAMQGAVDAEFTLSLDGGCGRGGKLLAALLRADGAVQAIYQA